MSAATITVRVKSRGGADTHLITISPTANIGDLRASIVAAGVTPTVDMTRILAHAHVVTDNSILLADLGIVDESTVFVVAAPSGVPVRSSSTGSGTVGGGGNGNGSSSATITTASPPPPPPPPDLSQNDAAGGMGMGMGMGGAGDQFDLSQLLNGVMTAGGSAVSPQTHSIISTPDAPAPPRWFPASIMSSLDAAFDRETEYVGVVHRMPYSYRQEARVAHYDPTTQSMNDASAVLEHLSQGHADIISPTAVPAPSYSSTVLTTSDHSLEDALDNIDPQVLTGNASPTNGTTNAAVLDHSNDTTNSTAVAVPATTDDVTGDISSSTDAITATDAATTTPTVVESQPSPAAPLEWNPPVVEPSGPLSNDITSYSVPTARISQYFSNIAPFVSNVSTRLEHHNTIIRSPRDLAQLRYDTRRLGSILRRLGTAAIDLGSALNHIDWGEGVPVGHLAANPNPAEMDPQTATAPLRRNAPVLRGPQTLIQSSYSSISSPFANLLGGLGGLGGLLGGSGGGAPAAPPTRRARRRRAAAATTGGTASGSTSAAAASAAHDTPASSSESTTADNTTTPTDDAPVMVDIIHPPEVPQHLAMLGPDVLTSLGHLPVGIPMPHYVDAPDMLPPAPSATTVETPALATAATSAPSPQQTAASSPVEPVSTPAAITPSPPAPTITPTVQHTDDATDTSDTDTDEQQQPQVSVIAIGLDDSGNTVSAAFDPVPLSSLAAPAPTAPRRQRRQAASTDTTPPTGTIGGQAIPRRRRRQNNAAANNPLAAMLGGMIGQISNSFNLSNLLSEALTTATAPPGANANNDQQLGNLFTSALQTLGVNATVVDLGSVTINMPEEPQYSNTTNTNVNLPINSPSHHHHVYDDYEPLPAPDTPPPPLTVLTTDHPEYTDIQPYSVNRSLLLSTASDGALPPLPSLLTLFVSILRLYPGLISIIMSNVMSHATSSDPGDAIQSLFEDTLSQYDNIRIPLSKELVRALTLLHTIRLSRPNQQLTMALFADDSSSSNSSDHDDEDDDNTPTPVPEPVLNPIFTDDPYAPELTFFVEHSINHVLRLIISPIFISSYIMSHVDAQHEYYTTTNHMLYTLYVELFPHHVDDVVIRRLPSTQQPDPAQLFPVTYSFPYNEDELVTLHRSLVGPAVSDFVGYMVALIRYGPMQTSEASQSSTDVVTSTASYLHNKHINLRDIGATSTGSILIRDAALARQKTQPYLFITRHDRALARQNANLNTNIRVERSALPVYLHLSQMVQPSPLISPTSDLFAGRIFRLFAMLLGDVYSLLRFGVSPTALVEDVPALAPLPSAIWSTLGSSAPRNMNSAVARLNDIISECTEIDHTPSLLATQSVLISLLSSALLHLEDRQSSEFDRSTTQLTLLPSSNPYFTTRSPAYLPQLYPSLTDTASRQLLTTEYLSNVLAHLSAARSSNMVNPSIIPLIEMASLGAVSDALDYQVVLTTPTTYNPTSLTILQSAEYEELVSETKRRLSHLQDALHDTTLAPYGIADPIPSSSSTDNTITPPNTTTTTAAAVVDDDDATTTEPDVAVVTPTTTVDAAPSAESGRPGLSHAQIDSDFPADQAPRRQWPDPPNPIVARQRVYRPRVNQGLHAVHDAFTQHPPEQVLAPMAELEAECISFAGSLKPGSGTSYPTHRRPRPPPSQ